MEGIHTSGEIMFGIGFYTICSSVMLITNKVAVTLVPVPGLVVCLQFLVAVLFIYGRSYVADIKVDTFTYDRVLKFLPYVASMSLCIFANVKALHFANVETVIVFRACSPMCVSILDWRFLGRELPSSRSALSLLSVGVGAIGYVLTDSAFKMNGIGAYTWVMIYFVAIVVEMTYGKQVMSQLSFNSPVWGSALYTNLLCLPPMLAMAIFNSETSQLQELEITLPGVLVVSISCFLGVGMSWAGWNCREKVSATTFTLIGVACKFITVLINIIIWDKHATAVGFFFLSICIGASALYRQAPMRAKPVAATKVDTEFGLDEMVSAQDAKVGA
jgi:GDP-mannose transporter